MSGRTHFAALPVALLLSSIFYSATPGVVVSAQKSPDDYLAACRPEVHGKVDEDARDLGVPGGIVEIELDQLPTVQVKGAKTEISGGGRFRLGQQYDWQALTWTCRYDDRKAKVDKVSYRGDRRAAAEALASEFRQPLQRCRTAVTSNVAEQASERRWKLGMVRVEPGVAAAFDERQGARQVSGVGDVKLQVSYGVTVTMKYTCTFEPETMELLETAVFLGSSSYTRDGQLLENKYETLTCASRDYEENRCSTSRPIAGNVRVKNQLSKTSCSGRFRWETWAIIVRDGCRAEFEFEVR